jgi:hypothetical protein
LGGHEVRTIVHVDGLNLFCAIRSSGCKWLNLNALRTIPEVEIHFGTFLGAFRRPLDQVFAVPSHLVILRAFLEAAEGVSGLQVARQAGVSHQTCAVTLGRLEELGLGRRQGSGQAQLFQLFGARAFQGVTVF